MENGKWRMENGEWITFLNYHKAVMAVTLRSLRLLCAICGKSLAYSAFSKMENNHITHTLTCILLFLIVHVHAQSYVDGGNTRHRFAQINFGADYRYFSGQGTQTAFFDAEGHMKKEELNGLSEMRLIVGGTHFWGHADFFIAIPIIKLSDSGYTTGVETGGKYFPWRIENKKLRPYIGISMFTTEYEQGDGAHVFRFKYPVIGGLVFDCNNHLFELGAGYNYRNEEQYYISITTQTDVTTQPYWISFGYKFMFDSTVGAEKDWESGHTQWLTDTLASLHQLNGLTLGIGFSSTFFLKPSEHNESVAPYIDNHSVALFPEYEIGYYLHKPDMQFNLSYRNIKSEISAYGYWQEAKEKR